MSARFKWEGRKDVVEVVVEKDEIFMDETNLAEVNRVLAYEESIDEIQVVAKNDEIFLNEANCEVLKGWGEENSLLVL